MPERPSSPLNKRKGGDGRPRAPDGLGRAGKRLWASIVGEYELDSRELLVLEQAARQADAVQALEAEVSESGIVGPGSRGQMRLSPTVVELRQARLALTKLLGELALPTPDEEMLPSRRGRKAAEARWNGSAS